MAAPCRGPLESLLCGGTWRELASNSPSQAPGRPAVGGRVAAFRLSLVAACVAAAGLLAASLTGFAPWRRSPAPPAPLRATADVSAEWDFNPFDVAAGSLGERISRLGEEGALPTEWEVLYRGGINVRASKSSKADVLLTVKGGTVVLGVKSGNWLELSAMDGYMAIRTPEVELLRERPQVSYSVVEEGCEATDAHRIEDPEICKHAMRLLGLPEAAARFEDECSVTSSAFTEEVDDSEAGHADKQSDSGSWRPLTSRRLGQKVAKDSGDKRWLIMPTRARSVCSSMPYQPGVVMPVNKEDSEDADESEDSDKSEDSNDSEDSKGTEDSENSEDSEDESHAKSTTMRPQVTLTTSEGSKCVHADKEQHSFYLYRAQSESNYPMENVNMADLPGVMWYLHNEVMTMCPRKYDITRVLRFKVTIHPSEALRMKGKLFGNFVAYDRGMCTVPACETFWGEGYNIGCQLSLGDEHGGYKGQWFSLPGPCPQRDIDGKDDDCKSAWPGGACDDATGADDCTYHVNFAGEVDIANLTNVSNYTTFCADGGLEYNRDTDKGTHMSFWNNISSKEKCDDRVEKLRRAFHDKYSRDPKEEWRAELPEVSGCSVCERSD